MMNNTLFKNKFEAEIAAQIAMLLCSEEQETEQRAACADQRAADQRDACVDQSGVRELLGRYYERYRLSFGEGRIYWPDFVLPNGVIVEAKGVFRPQDRKKHLAIREEYPQLDIRFVFYNAEAKQGENRKGTYASWCRKYGFQYANRELPPAWVREAPTEERMKSLNLLEEAAFTFPLR
jgi:hypothetical protein